MYLSPVNKVLESNVSQKRFRHIRPAFKSGTRIYYCCRKRTDHINIVAVRCLEHTSSPFFAELSIKSPTLISFEKVNMQITSFWLLFSIKKSSFHRRSTEFLIKLNVRGDKEDVLVCISSLLSSFSIIPTYSQYNLEPTRQMVCNGLYHIIDQMYTTPWIPTNRKFWSNCAIFSMKHNVHPAGTQWCLRHSICKAFCFNFALYCS